MTQHHRTRSHAGWPILAAISQGFAFVYQFIRFPVLNFSVMLPLLGAATVTPHLTSAQIVGFMIVAVSFHVFAYVLNDVIDLPVDRTEPLRQESPLLQGMIRPQVALLIALLQIPLAVGSTAWLGGRGSAYGTLAVGFAMMTIYNLWGKRTPFPPLTDAIQGLGWSAIGLYGICVLNYPPTMLTGAFLVYVFVLVLMINGVHGALRDLTNDFHQGMLTTAILLGARPKGDLGIYLPPRLKYYALILQVFLLGSSLLPLLANWFGYRPVTWGITTTVMGLVAAATLYCLVRAMGSVDNRWNLIRFGMFHLVLSLGTLVLPFLYDVHGTLRVVLLMVYLVPVLAMWLRYGFKWG